MTISLSPEIARFVEQKVREGNYTSADALIEDAVRQMQTFDEPEFAPGELERLIAVGQAEADAGLLIDGPKSLEERRRRRAARPGSVT
jgi:putative addiction module CopG family antidote